MRRWIGPLIALVPWGGGGSMGQMVSGVYIVVLSAGDVRMARKAALLQ